MVTATKIKAARLAKKRRKVRRETRIEVPATPPDSRISGNPGSWIFVH